ncbi:hypothetical protein [Streptomyces kaempferi]|uniref:Uncharacterized protein n=1 Tax=Streptomyces kaempferi TaxID=333725 RepID=A0ABW3X7E9_9ACTN
MTRTRPGSTPARPPDEQSTRTPARADVRLMPIGEPVRPLPLPHEAVPPSAADLFRQHVESLAAQFHTVVAGAGEA